MRVIDHTIYFKSDEWNYWKEFNGSKANTIRNISDEEMNDFGLVVDPRGFLKSYDTIIDRISIGCGNRNFDRRITDVTVFDGYLIFSWDRLDS